MSDQHITTRTQAEIVARAHDLCKTLFGGMTIGDFLDWLDFEHAKPFIKVEVTPEEWAKISAEVKPIRVQMAEYMPFAWEKANNCRGLSAGRSIQHYQNWLWLLGEDALVNEIEHYEYYGKDQLTRVCEFLGLDARQWDDGVRTNTDG